MRDLYEQECAWFYHLIETFEYVTGSIYDERIDKESELWPLGLLQSWNALCDKALEEIAPLYLTDPANYELVRKKIITESISPRFAILSLHKGMFSGDSFREMATSFREDAMASKITMHRESADCTLASKYSEWGI